MSHLFRASIIFMFHGKCNYQNVSMVLGNNEFKFNQYSSYVNYLGIAI